jgi:hypothetical protein
MGRKLTDLTAAGAFNGAETLYVEQAGGPKSATSAQVRALVTSSNNTWTGTNDFSTAPTVGGAPMTNISMTAQIALLF